MEQLKGVLTSIGDAKTYSSPNGFGSETQYSYIEIGERRLRNIQVSQALSVKLEQAMSTEVTLFVENGYICGLIGEDGRPFVSENGASAFETCLYAAFGICAIPLFGLGLLVLFQAADIKTLWQVRKAGLSIPNAIPV